MARTREPASIVFAVDGAVDRKDVPALCARLRALLESGAGDLVVCDVERLARVDFAAVDALARLALTARRHGRQFRVRNASAELRCLLELVGLLGVVELETDSAVDPRGKAEQRKEPRGIEEEADPGDSIA